MSDIYHLYKPLRNLTRKYDLGSGLLTCYRYIQFLDFDIELPEKLRHPRLLTKLDKMRMGLLQWEFEILIRELILNGARSGGKPLDNWADVAKLINAIKWLENEKWARASQHENDVLYELVRIAHRQFPWQTGFNRAYLARYHWLYRQPGIMEAVKSEYGMTPTELFQIGFSLVGHFLKNPFVKLPLNNQMNSVSREVSDALIDRLCMSMEEAQQKYIELAEYNINWPYTFNPLKASPLIRGPQLVFCPIPSFLIRRLTSGLYYDLVADKILFSDHFGPAVQNMIGKAAAFANQDGAFTVLEEAQYGPKRARKASIDWIISDSTAHLFLESKGARVRFRGMSDLTDQRWIISEFSRIRDFAFQTYKSLHHALRGDYVHWSNDDRAKYVMIVTLEDWQSFGMHVEQHVLKPVKSLLIADGIEPEIVDRHPLSFCPIEDFEAMMHVANVVGLDELLKRKSSGEYPQWAMGTFLTNNFASELQEYVPKAFDDEWRVLGSPM